MDRYRIHKQNKNCYIVTSVAIPAFILPVWIDIVFRLFGGNAGFQYRLVFVDYSKDVWYIAHFRDSESINLRQFFPYALDSGVQMVLGDVYRTLHYQIGHGASRAGGSCDGISNVTLKVLHSYILVDCAVIVRQHRPLFHFPTI